MLPAKRINYNLGLAANEDRQHGPQPRLQRGNSLRVGRIDPAQHGVEFDGEVRQVADDGGAKAAQHLQPINE